LRARYGEKVKTPLIAEKKGLLGRFMPSVSRDALGALAGMPDEWVSSVEARALWSRYGF
jgi:hypothetical protein